MDTESEIERLDEKMQAVETMISIVKDKDLRNDYVLQLSALDQYRALLRDITIL